MTQISLNQNDPPRLAHDQNKHLEAMTDAEISDAAADDPHNPPLSEDELDRLRTSKPNLRQARAAG